MPQLIQAGKVYKAIPPLYGWKNGKKVTYFTNQMDFVRFVQKLFIESNKLSVLGSKTPMSGKDITLLFMNNEDYLFYVDTLADTYGVDPLLLELGLLSHVNGYAMAETKKKLKDISRFMTMEKSGSNVIFDGTIRESNFMVLGDQLLRECRPLIDIMKKNTSFYFDMNGRPVSLYQVMKSFDESTPKGTRRYKGLGEMDEVEIPESTLLPTSDRTLIQYTLDNMKEEFEAIKAYESDRSKLLQFVGNVKRVDLLD
jgi:DNA gyrase/topoisomerase IV subunit B